MMEYNYQQLISIYTGEINPNMILRLPDNAYILNNPDSVDWQAYQEWLSQGNQPLPPA